MNKGYNQCLTGFCEFSGQVQTRRFLNVPVSQEFRHSIGERRTELHSFYNTYRTPQTQNLKERYVFETGIYRRFRLSLEINLEFISKDRKHTERYIQDFIQKSEKKLRPILIAQAFQIWQERIL